MMEELSVLYVMKCDLCKDYIDLLRQLLHKLIIILKQNLYKNGIAATTLEFQTGGVRLDSKVFKPVTDHNVLSRLPTAARSHVSNKYEVKRNHTCGFFRQVELKLDVTATQTSYYLATLDEETRCIKLTLQRRHRDTNDHNSCTIFE